MLWFEGDSDPSWGAWGDTLIAMTDALAHAAGFRIPNDTYRECSGQFVHGVDFEWSNGVASIWSDVPHEIIIVFDSTLRPRKAEALVEALMKVWAALRK